MNPNDWRRTEELFHKVVGLSPEERAAYLDQACPDDASLRAEVESLITAFENQRGFLERPAFSLGMKMLSGESKEESLDGKLIGPYRVHSLLGEGGMGKVYLAHDGLLDRKVALKFLSHKFTDDAWAKRQLIKEAQAIARLDHPNICAVHGFEEHEGYAFIVMQYVEGETLASLIQRGLPEAEQIPRLAVQIVSALVEAHSHGIVHRDIKPQNIMVAANGQAKVLDFGLAKLIQQKQDVLNAGESESSQLGLVLGTVAYMSPEQLRDERLDFRSDIFSFGIVLYEMICGRNPYSRATKADTISAILTSGPEWPPKLPTDIQARLAAIAQKCLRKEREQRYQSASELLLALDNPDKRNPTPWPRPIRLSLRMYAVLALLLLIIITASFVYFRPVRARTLAVLPIVYEYANANTEYLGEGLTESLINKLSSISTLEVKPLTMVSVYKNQKVDPVQFGRDLNVDLLFLGTI
ncbi:MAG TPA: serine/threonine-protein kinase, partial [Blastocatellia bacterium]|nr:serine/threonine-protein kinase [Blastocatellia bacterium]